MARGERLSDEGQPPPRRQRPAKSRQWGLGRGQQGEGVQAHLRDHIPTESAWQPLDDKVPKGRTEGRPHHYVSGFECEGNRTLGSRLSRYLCEEGEVGRFALQQTAEVEVLDQAQRKTVLERRVQREVD